MHTHPHRTNRPTRGFTLVETLIAITILTTSIAGPLTIAAKSLSSALFARDQITAFYLAQDAVEYVRNVRDSNVLKGNDWLDGLESCVGLDCRLEASDTNPATSVASCSGTCPRLLYDDLSGFYGYALGDPSGFTRTIRLTKVNEGNDNEYAITVSISWSRGILSRSFTVREHLLNWQL